MLGMKSDSFEPATAAAHLFGNWFDPIESGVRERVREFIEELIRASSTRRYLAHATDVQRVLTAVRQALLATGMAAARAR